VLAGTIIRGGNQDRQIAQDFIVEPRQVTPVGAFCVEQGRWNEVRDGSATGGRFTTAGKLAVSDVRTAAQYDRDQSKVWSNVAEVNRKHGKGASTGTLLATLDDAAIERQLLPFASELRARLAAVEPQGQVVGFAYAINGKLRGARWFAHRKIFELFRDALTSTAALEALTAQPDKAPKKALTPADIVARLKEVDDAPVVATETTKAGKRVQVNFQSAPAGRGLKVHMRPAPGANPYAPPKPVSRDYAY
jgi:hypothetical protein